MNTGSIQMWLAELRGRLGGDSVRLHIDLCHDDSLRISATTTNVRMQMVLHDMLESPAVLMEQLLELGQAVADQRCAATAKDLEQI